MRKMIPPTLTGLICLSCLFLPPPVSPSSIPMWEFLTRNEKMTHLYNMFVKQVVHHCDISTMPDCQKVLLVYGLTNLAKMGDDSLDKMDPYQRGANGIIWDSMMNGASPKNTLPHRGGHFPVTMETSMSQGGGNQVTSEEEESKQFERYLVGPMVVRLLPDGHPVPEDATLPLPKDGDNEENISMRSIPIPSIDGIYSQPPTMIPIIKPQTNNNTTAPKS